MRNPWLVLVLSLLPLGCGVETTFSPGPVCGNGSIELGEGCDDGNVDDTDDCSNDCRPTSCGDGVVHWSLEDCDDGNDDDTDACPSTCHVAYCGDGFVHTGIEQCDTAGASADCDWDCSVPVCGDGILNRGAGEQCDQGAQNSDHRADGCREDCSLPFCGDGVHDSGEECDSGEHNGANPNACSASCRIPYCGDGVVNEGERCDPGAGDSFCSTTCTPTWQATAITVGWWHACALLPDGRPICWGNNNLGQSSPPEELRLTQISAGGYHTCGLTEDGEIVCWGAGESESEESCYFSCNGDLCQRLECGQSAAPKGAYLFVAAGGNHTCAIASDHTVICWGDSFHGATEAPMVGFDSLDATDQSTCGTTTTGEVICWGNVFVDVPTIHAVAPYATVSTSPGAVCALTASGEASCWGTAAPAGTFDQIEASYFSQVCTLDPLGALACATGTSTSTLSPRVLQSRFARFATNNFSGCGLTVEDHVLCWGWIENNYEQVPMVTDL